MTTDPKRSAIDAPGNDATEDQFAQARKHKFDDDAGSAIIQYAEYVSNNDDASSITLSHTPEKSTDPKYAKELLEAVHRGSIPLVEIMLKHVDADVRDPRSGRTALFFCSRGWQLRSSQALAGPRRFGELPPVQRQHPHDAQRSISTPLGYHRE